MQEYSFIWISHFIIDRVCQKKVHYKTFSMRIVYLFSRGGFQKWSFLVPERVLFPLEREHSCFNAFTFTFKVLMKLIFDFYSHGRKFSRKVCKMFSTRIKLMKWLIFTSPYSYSLSFCENSKSMKLKFFGFSDSH